MTQFSIPYVEVGGEGSPLHFSHANGYPPLCYRALLQPFTQSHRVFASQHRPLWQPSINPESLTDWRIFGEDVIKLVQQQGKRPVISIGHSMGAVAILLAAIARPDLFKSVVLIDPVIIPRRYFFGLALLGRFAHKKNPMIKKTLGREDQWQSPQEAFDYHRGKWVFKKITDEVLWDYINYGTRKTDSGSVTLTYSKEWEVQCYMTVHNTWKLFSQCKVPMMVIRGMDSNIAFPPQWRSSWPNLSPQPELIDMPDCGHLLPLEKPVEVAQEIQAWLDKQRS